MNKMEVKERADLAWFKSHGEPGGYSKYLEMKGQGLSQSKRARAFDVDVRTMWRWDQEEDKEVARG